MTAATYGTQNLPGEESAISAVSWGAVLAGAVIASSLSIALLALGSGIGLVSVSPWSNGGVSATTFGVLTVAWFAALQLFSCGVGGYIAGRLRTRWVSTHNDEVFFRDTAHGFLVWGVGTLLSASLLASSVAAVVGGATQIGTATIQAAGTAVGAAARSDGTAYFTDMLFRSDKPATQPSSSEARAEVERILAMAAIKGDLDGPDKTYLAQVIGRQTGLNQADSDKRLADVLTEAKAAAAKAADTAKQVADTARKIGVYASLWAFASLLIGAFAACYMATVGGRIRDDLPAMG
jgi:hypothetical protein